MGEVDLKPFWHFRRYFEVYGDCEIVDTALRMAKRVIFRGKVKINAEILVEM